MTSSSVLGFTVIIPTVFSSEVSDGEDLSWCFWWVSILLVPGVISCWVSITATGQIHWTALHYLSRGTYWHRGRSWSIWKKNVIAFFLNIRKIKRCYHWQSTVPSIFFLITFNICWNPQLRGKLHWSVTFLLGKNVNFLSNKWTQTYNNTLKVFWFYPQDLWAKHYVTDSH